MQRILYGAGVWSQGVAAVERADTWPGALSGVWVDEWTCVAQLRWYETPFGQTLTCRFEGERLVVHNQQANVWFGPTDRPRLDGQPV